MIMNYSDNINENKNTIKQNIEYFVEKYGGAYSINTRGSIIFLLKMDENMDFKSYIYKLKKDISIIAKNLKKYKIYFSSGIGNVAQGYKFISQSYNQSKDALELGIEIYGKNSITSYNDLGIYKLLRDFPNRELLENYIPNSIKVLKEHDRAKKSELLKTLEVYLENNQKIISTAQELFVHKKTVSYRIEQIKNIANIDFNNSNEIMEIQIALKIYKFIKKDR